MSKNWILAPETSKKYNSKKLNLLSSRSPLSKVMGILLFLIKSTLHSCFFFSPLWAPTLSYCCITIAYCFSFFIFCFSFLIFHFFLSVFQFSVFVFRFHFLFFVFRFSFSVFHFSFSFFVDVFWLLIFVFQFLIFAFCFSFSLFVFVCIVVLRQASSARRPSYYIILYKVCTPYNTMHVYLRIITSSSKVCWRFC